MEIGGQIDRAPEIRGGRPKIASTGLTVRRIVGRYKMVMSPEEIAVEYPRLNLAQAHAALAYYHANREEIEDDIAEAEAMAALWQARLAGAPTANGNTESQSR